MATTDDVLARARAVAAELVRIEGEATPGPFHAWSEAGDDVDHIAYFESCLRGDTDLSMVWAHDDERPGNHLAVAITGDGPASASNAAAIVAYRNAVPALLRLAEAVGRLASESGGGRTWWEKVGLHGTPRWCMICNGSATPPLADSSVVHRPGCPAIEIDAALAELAALDGAP